MSREIMAECLEEATNLLAEMFPESPEGLDPMVIVAVALYQERMRETNQVGFRLDKASMEAIRSMGHDEGV